jgi:hypothetical protein
MKKLNYFLATFIAMACMLLTEKLEAQITDNNMGDPMKTIVCPGRIIPYQLSPTYSSSTNVYSLQIKNGTSSGGTSTQISGINMVHITWNNVSSTNTDNTGVIIMNGPGLTNFQVQFTILTVKDYQVPTICINNNEWIAPSYTLQSNSFTIGVVNNNNNNIYYPNAPQQNETILSSFQWVLPSGMTSGGKSGTFTGGKIITVDATNFVGTGTIKVRPINHQCENYIPDDYYGVYKEISVSKAISATISGSSTVCSTPGIYTLSFASNSPAGTATSWSVTPASAFSITASNATSATVKALSYAGTQGTLTAIINGVAVTKTVASCNIAISGPSPICATPATYTISSATATSWTIQPASAFSLTSQNAMSAVVKALIYAGVQGTLTAIAGGTTVTKTIATCNDYSVVITGPSSVCPNSTVTFTVLNYPPAYTWNSSYRLTLLSTSGNSASFSVNSQFIPIEYTAGYATLETAADNDQWVGILAGGDQVAQRNLTISGIAPAGGINGPYSTSGNYILTSITPGTYQFVATNVPSNLSNFGIQWELKKSNSASTTRYTGQNPLIYFGSQGSYTLRMRYFGSCGYSAYATKTVVVTGGSISGFLSAYPNPASSTLYVEIEEELQTMLQSQQSSALSSASSSAVVYRVQLVAAQTGAVAYNQILSSSSDNLSISLSNIPDGLYSLIVTKNNTLLHSETVLIQH